MALKRQVEEHPLSGGNANSAVVRVGATVRRAASPQTPTLRRLLTHVRTQGTTWVPGMHGCDEQGREVLDYLDGDVPHGEPAFVWADHVLVEVGRSLRQWHDATATFERSSEDIWFGAPRQPAEVICHGDFAPYNHVFREGHFVGAIDFDTCVPAPRLWDLAWTAYRYVPLRPAAAQEVDDSAGADRSPFAASAARARVERLLDAYGPLAHPGDVGPERVFAVAELLAWVPERLYAIAEWGESQASADHRRWALMYRAHARWVADGGLSAQSR